MRILITHPIPLDDCPSGQAVRRLAGALRSAGHDVHLFVVAARDAAAGEASAIRTVTCRRGDLKAELDFDVPGFESVPPAGRTFGDLTDEQLARYRETLRQALDREVDQFDPQVVHVEYAWLQGQLVLETGVPYVVRLWGPELTSCAGAPRIRALAQQAAENAGRVIVAGAAQAEAARRAFDLAAERIVVLPPGDPDAETFVRLYRTVLEERFGQSPQ
jgi:hypothetical protein